MTAIPPAPQRPPARRVVLDVLAVLLMLAGLAGVLAGVWQRLGLPGVWVARGLVAFGVGSRMGREEGDE